jgi:hypothetical protein
MDIRDESDKKITVFKLSNGTKLDLRGKTICNQEVYSARQKKNAQVYIKIIVFSLLNHLLTYKSPLS